MNKAIRMVSVFLSTIIIFSIFSSGSVQAEAAIAFAEPRLPFDRSPIGVTALTYGGDPTPFYYGDEDIN